MTITDKQVSAALAHYEQFRITQKPGDMTRAKAMRALLEAAEAARECAVPPYDSVMGEAAQRYIKSVGGSDDVLPQTFRWQGLWDAMIAAAPSSAKPAAQVDQCVEECGIVSADDEISMYACAFKLPIGTKLYTTPQPSAPSEPNAAWVDAVESYAAAARVIALHLKKFCDETLPYPEMIADAARNAAAEIERLSAQPSADDAPGSYSAKVATQVYDALLSTIAAIRAAGVLQHRDYDRIGIKANDAILAFQYERDRKLAAPPADARDADRLRHVLMEMSTTEADRLGLRLDDFSIDACRRVADRAMGGDQ